MDRNAILLKHLPGLSLKRVGEEQPAGLWVTSLPLPRGAEKAWSLGGHPTHAKPIGKWWDAPGPRRLLLAADGGNQAPQTVAVGAAVPAAGGALPEASMEVFAHAEPKDLGAVYWERSMLKISWGGRWVGLAMGMRAGEQIHWWEHCHLVKVAQSATCLELEMGGNVPYDIVTTEVVNSQAGRDVPIVHKHNALTCMIYARLHSNGVCEIYARHVNSMFVDDGADLRDAVAIMGIKVEGGEAAAKPVAEALGGVWDGTRPALNIGPAAFDMTEPARLATPANPGRIEATKDGFLVLQPYEGVEAFGGPLTAKRQGDPYMWRGAAHIIPRGMARTLRFSLSLNPQRSPRVQRYLAPEWWYGLCEEFGPPALLPAGTTEYDAMIDASRQWFRKYMQHGGFGDGYIPVSHDGDPNERRTPAAEGDVAGTLCMVAYRTGDPVDYDTAMRSCYHHTDVWIDHASKKVRYQGYTAPASALPLERVHSCIMAWLEQGDNFCIQAAQAVIQTAYWWHKNSWPRSAVGRDANFVHGAMLLYRHTGQDYYRSIARDTIMDVGAAQWPDGSFGDQGGGAGIHGAAAYIIKPWMGCMATLGALDYLEHFPDDAEVHTVVEKFVNWLMAERAPRTVRAGAPVPGPVMGWTYQHQFRGKQLEGVTITPPPTTGAHLFHLDHFARLMGYFSLRTGDPKYFEAFAESFEGSGTTMLGGYVSCAPSFNFLPWISARLWEAELTERGVEVRPRNWGKRTPREGWIATPKGRVRVSWSKDGKAVVESTPGLEVVVRT